MTFKTQKPKKDNLKEMDDPFGQKYIEKDDPDELWFQNTENIVQRTNPAFLTTKSMGFRDEEAKEIREKMAKGEYEPKEVKWMKLDFS